MAEGKPFGISKWAVFSAWAKVRDNQGAAGVDGVSIKEFERKLKNNLYRIWNRTSSGSYVPPPVKRVMIPKADGKQRPLGIPTVGDRVAQRVVKTELESKVERLFHPDGYGYRPKKSALDAVGKCRQRCWRYDWIVDLDVKGFFDNIDHSLMMHAVRKHTDCPWMLLYVERGLKAPKELEELSRTFNSKIRGWLAYYGRYYPTALHRTMQPLNRPLVRWAQQKYQRFRRHQGQAWDWPAKVAGVRPHLFARWATGFVP
jgi:retron-type reverse transcriptase